MKAFAKRVLRKARDTFRKPPPLTAFGEKIAARQRRLWTETHSGMHDGNACKNELLTRADGLERWHCCPLWQRKLSNKWNSREFVSKFGVRVPDLYWSGDNLRELDFQSLPEHYVIRSATGHSGKNIFVMAEGVNLLDKKKYSEAILRTVLRTRTAEGKGVGKSVIDFNATQVEV